MNNRNPVSKIRNLRKTCFNYGLLFKESGLFFLGILLLGFLPITAGAQCTKDGDVLSPTRRNTQFINRKKIVEHVETVKIGDEQFCIFVFTKKGPNKQKYLVVHDSEDAAFDNGLRAIKHGGTFIALENKENRNLYSFGQKRGLTNQDPNRMFNKDNPYWPVAQKILQLCDAASKNLIIVLHNNKPGGDFNLDHIQHWKNITVASREDTHQRSMMWIPGASPEPQGKIIQEIKHYKKSGFNVIYEFVPPDERGDGSLSVYATKHGIPYRNIEVESGIRGNRRSELKSRRKQKKYLNALRRYHGIK